MEYRLLLEYTQSVVYEIEAETEEEAKDKAYDRYIKEMINDELITSPTFRISNYRNKTNRNDNRKQ